MTHLTEKIGIHIKRMGKKLFLLFLAGSAFACQETSPGQGNFLITQSEPAEGKFLLSEITTDVRIIPLETSDSSLIRRIEKIVHKEGHYYIKDGNKRLMVFDGDGKYLRTISGIGQGPGEYASLKDFDVDPARNTIAIADLGKIHFYDLDGTYRNTIYVIDGMRNMILLPDGNIALRTDGGEKVLRILDAKGTVLGEYIDKRPYLRHRLFKNIEFFPIGDRVFSQDGMACNDLWCYQNGEISRWNAIDDPRGISGEQEDEYIRDGGLAYQQNNSDVLRIFPIIAGKNFTMVSASAGNNYFLYLRDNRTGKTKRFKSWPDFSITDDILFLDIGTLFFHSSYTETDDQFVTFADAYLIAEGLEKHADLAGTDNYRKTRQLLDSLGELDNANPVLLTFDFKRSD